MNPSSSPRLGQSEKQEAHPLVELLHAVVTVVCQMAKLIVLMAVGSDNPFGKAGVGPRRDPRLGDLISTQHLRFIRFRSDRATFDGDL